MDISLIWAIIIALGVAIYVILDGFDIGIGILFPFVKGKVHKDIMMNSIAPFWDGNETWLVLGGVALFTAFPLAYSVILPALYLPLTIFIVALIFRGVSFEFRIKSTKTQFIWNKVFAISSIIMAFSQGIVLGAFVQGFNLDENYMYIGTQYEWFSLFSIMTGIALVCGYGLLGATWLIIKTSGALQDYMQKIAKMLGLLMLFFIGAVSLWTPLTQPEIASRWFSIPNFFYLMPVPLLTLIISFLFFKSLMQKKYDFLPFVYTICLFMLSYLGLAISIWPYIIPRHVTIWQAAAYEKSQIFSLVGVLILLPLVILYTYNSYRIFSGKIKAGEKFY